MTSQLVIFRVFFVFVIPDPKFENIPVNQLNRKILALFMNYFNNYL